MSERRDYMLHPNSLFPKYKEKIADLDTINKESIQTEQFLLYQDPKIQIYYAPHNEYINEKANVFIIGITPGWSQTQIAFQTAKNGIGMCCTDEEICFKCKVESRFAGTMRKNLISMLDDLNLQEYLGLKSCLELFDKDKSLLHTTSLIKYPCFYKGKNYSGHTPAIGSIDILRKYIMEDFSKELDCVPNLQLIIPLGAAVEGILKELFVPESIQYNKVLWGFPHPSGLNGRRKLQFEKNRKSMVNTLENVIYG